MLRYPSGQPGGASWGATPGSGIGNPNWRLGRGQTRSIAQSRRTPPPRRCCISRMSPTWTPRSWPTAFWPISPSAPARRRMRTLARCARRRWVSACRRVCPTAIGCQSGWQSDTVCAVCVLQGDEDEDEDEDESEVGRSGPHAAACCAGHHQQRAAAAACCCRTTRTTRTTRRTRRTRRRARWTTSARWGAASSSCPKTTTTPR